MSMNFEGGKAVIDRLQKAYGFSKRKDFGEYLGISPNTFSSWVKRDFFPADLVIRCVKETGARLDYVAYGEEPIFDDLSDVKYFHRVRLESGKLFEMTPTAFTLPHLPHDTDPEKTLCALEENRTYFVNTDYGNLIDGDYMVAVENSKLIRYLTVLPGGKVRLDGGKFSFEAAVSDIEIVGRVILKMERV